MINQLSVLSVSCTLINPLVHVYTLPAVSRRKCPDLCHDLFSVPCYLHPALSRNKSTLSFSLVSASSSLQKRKENGQSCTFIYIWLNPEQKHVQTCARIYPFVHAVYIQLCPKEYCQSYIMIFPLVLIICVWLPMKKAVRTTPGFILSVLSLCGVLKKGAKAEP